MWLAARGGGIGITGEMLDLLMKQFGNGKTSGIIPFLKVQDSRLCNLTRILRRKLGCISTN